MAVSLPELKMAFRARFGGDPSVSRAPGRVNLIGEHTDYNSGFVLPMAIDRSVYVAFEPRADDDVVLYALDLDRSTRFSSRQIERDSVEPWSNYVRGVALMLHQRGLPLRGMNAILHGDVPIGSGLSSSAALEVSVAVALLATSEQRLERTEIALVCQRAEATFVGVNCGIMDQFVSALARRGHALLIDCHDLSYQPVPLDDPDVKVVVVDSMIRRQLADSRYNERRQECEDALKHLQMRSLRDVSPPDFRARQASLPEPLRRRVAHVVGENQRVKKFAKALTERDWRKAGLLMVDSHRSLRDDYQVSIPELDLLVEIALGVRGVYGSRLTGAGFGGCTVTLAERGALDALIERVSVEYRARTGLDPQVYVCEAGEGAGLTTG